MANNHHKIRVRDIINYLELFPHLDDDERVNLENQLREGSAWSMNFGVMLGCSVILAGLGLLQNSVAVIIGGDVGGSIDDSAHRDGSGAGAGEF